MTAEFNRNWKDKRSKKDLEIRETSIIHEEVGFPTIKTSKLAIYSSSTRESATFSLLPVFVSKTRDRNQRNQRQEWGLRGGVWDKIFSYSDHFHRDSHLCSKKKFWESRRTSLLKTMMFLSSWRGEWFLSHIRDSLSLSLLKEEEEVSLSSWLSLQFPNGNPFIPLLFMFPLFSHDCYSRNRLVSRLVVS